MLPLSKVFYSPSSHPAEQNAARSLGRRFHARVSSVQEQPEEGVFISLQSTWNQEIPAPEDTTLPWAYLKISEAGNGLIQASTPALLYALVHDTYIWNQKEAIHQGLYVQSSFSWNRPLFDSILNQVARTARMFDPETYIELLARHGFTHLEINGLASYIANEPRVAGEYYSQFYSYGPGLLQYVDSTLTRGLYDPAMLAANLQRMKHFAGLGKKYGLKPGMFCFEPRTLPERFFQRYPTLRGARVDHPLRSHMPRYTLAQDHPVVRDHYRELIQNLMHEIPDLAYMSIWTNDSGSGFEHTSSLYAGRNGGPYIIREWKTHDEIARAAGESAIRWLRLIQDTASAFNPDFEVSLRIESFKAEHDTIVKGMGNGVTVEAPSLLVHGYDLPYSHPLLPENKGIAGTMFHTRMDTRETDMLARYRAEGIEPAVHYAPSSTFNMEPLLGIPYPHMLYKKLASLKKTGIRRINAIGGLLHPDRTPYWPHPQIIKAFQLYPDRGFTDLIAEIASEIIGADHAADLINAWDLAERALSHMPYLPLFSNFGFVWYRLWIRPFVPDIEAIPSHERAYYERFMVTMANNPNMNDLGKDVLFELITQSSGIACVGAISFDTSARKLSTESNLAAAFVPMDATEINAIAGTTIPAD